MNKNIMNYKNILSISILSSAIIISGAVASSALAQSAFQSQEQKMPGDIQFPVKELGNCKSKEDCKIFCDDAKNTEACLKFAEEKNLLSSEELVKAKKFKDAGMVGPGGCKGQTECDAYCGDQTHMEACITFAIDNGMMDKQKLEESQKVLAALKKGVKPPACNGPKECDKYCSSSAHMEECMNFSIEAGIMDPQKQEESKKVLAAIKRGVKMPACSGPTECDAYCSSTEHMEECITFGIEAGMMPEQDKEKAQKMLAAVKQGIKPPACRGEQECQAYCSQESHLEECIKFGEATGMMKPEDSAMMRKTGGKGPGGCIGKDVCDAFCNDPNNQETCFNFAKDNGMIPQADLQKMQEGQQRMKDSFSQMPQEVLDCLNSSLGTDVVEKMRSGTAMLGPKTGDTMKGCFEKMPQGQLGGPGQDSPNNMPGDLKDCIRIQVGEDGLAKIQSGQMNDPALIEGVKSCFEKYGQPNQRDQFDQQGQNQQGQPGNNFQPGPGVINQGEQRMPQQAGPGGCKGPEECQKYCASNPEVCKNFKPQQDQQRKPGEGFDQSQRERSISGDIQRPIEQGQIREGSEGQKEGEIFERENRILEGKPLNPMMGEQRIREPFVCEGDKCNTPLGQGSQVQPGQYIQGQPGQQMPRQDQQIQDQPRQFIQIQPDQSGQIQPQFQGQPGQIYPQGTQPMQGQQQPFIQPQPMPPQGDNSGFQPKPVSPQSPPSSFLKNAEKILGNVLDVFR